MIIKYRNQIKEINFIIIIIICFINQKQRKILNKICLCAVGKEENKYIREFVEHYKNYDLDKMYIYDNNDKNGEKFEEVISDYIKSGFVELIDYRGIQQPQLMAYNDCYNRYNKIYDWLIFYDIDEYIYLKDFRSLKSFLYDKRFDKCTRVQLNWIFYTDNNNIYYQNKSLKKRFIERSPFSRGKTKGGASGIKSIIRGNLKNIKIFCPHILSKRTKSCDGFGKRKKPDYIITKISDLEYYYINHYAFKSTEEFIKYKLLRTDAYHKDDLNMKKIMYYFRVNNITKEKIDLIENRTKYKLSSYRNKIKY